RGGQRGRHRESRIGTGSTPGPGADAYRPVHVLRPGRRRARRPSASGAVVCSRGTTGGGRRGAGRRPPHPGGRPGPGGPPPRARPPVRAVVHPAEWVENNMAFHPGGRHLLTHGFDPATEETTCRLWDLEREADLPFPGDAAVVSAAAWDVTGERLAVGTPQGEVTIFSFPSSNPLHRLGFAGRITRLLFSPDGRYCALAAANRVRVWDCRQAAFATPDREHPAPIATLAFHPQGELLATGCKDQSCRVFAVPAATNAPLFSPVPHCSGGFRTVSYTHIPPL